MHPFTYLTVPTLMAEMEPEVGIALDIVPYNTFTFRCVANVPDTVLLQKSFEWRHGGNLIRDNGNTILISDQNTNMPRSTSELTVNALSIGSYTYLCSVSMLVPGGVNLVVHASGTVTVRGDVVALLVQLLIIHACIFF